MSSASGFHHAPLTKALLILLPLTSLLTSLFHLRPYTHLTLSPHLTRDLQLYRLLLPSLTGPPSSAQLLLTCMVLYHAARPVERVFGSRKFAGCLAACAGVVTLLEVAALVLGLGGGRVEQGGTGWLFAVLWQWYRVVPSTWHADILGLRATSKTWIYVLALLLAHSQPFPSLLGLLTGQLYRSSSPLNTLRPSPRLCTLSNRFLRPLIGSTRPPHRSNIVLPSDAPPAASSVSASASAAAQTPLQRTALSTWRDELAFPAPAPAQQADVQALEGMFPQAGREAVVRALQRSEGNVERAVERLLAGDEGS